MMVKEYKNSKSKQTTKGLASRKLNLLLLTSRRSKLRVSKEIKSLTINKSTIQTESFQIKSIMSCKMKFQIDKQKNNRDQIVEQKKKK